jgi:hypothetical protein
MKRICYSIGLTGAAAALLFSRCPAYVLHPQFHSEDGAIFFVQAFKDGTDSVFYLFAGYLHLVPRLVALAARPLPLEWLPSAYLWATILCTLYVFSRVLVARVPRVAAVTSAFALVLVPHGGEIWCSLCMLHFILGALVVINLLEPAPETRAESWRRGIEIAVAALSGPQVLILSPLLVAWSWRHRANQSAARMIVVGLAAATVQFSVMAFNPRPTNCSGVFSSAGAAIAGYSQSLFAGAVGGEIGKLAITPQLVVGVSCLFLILLVLSDRTNRFRGIALALFAVAAALLVTGKIGGISTHHLWPVPIGSGARYAYLPFVLAVWGMAWLLAGAQRRLMVAAAVILLLLVPLSTAHHWVAPTPTDYHWTQQVREYRAGHRVWFASPPPGWRFNIQPD